jgi:DNA-binding IclR family transcriptional regulator
MALPGKTAMTRPSNRAGRVETVPGRRIVQPVARALALLGAFSADERWLANGEFAARTGLPASTVSRLTHCLVMLGYLRYSAERRKYCLRAAALALGYAAIAQSAVQRIARERMTEFCVQHRVHLTLSRRDRLSLVVVETAFSDAAGIPLELAVGARLDLASTPIGWALLAALPEVERFYLLGNVERHPPRDWPRLRRRSSEAIAQVQKAGYCSSLGEWGSALAVVAAPLLDEGYAPLVLACVGPASQLSRARVERDLGPKLAGIAIAIAEEATGPQ